MTDAPGTNVSGWYADPAGIHHQRFWTGAAWTPRVADAYGVTAVHHLDTDHPSPSGDTVVAAPAKARTPALSLVESAAPEADAALDPHEPPVEATADDPVPQMLEAPIAPPGPPPAGWYTDPSGIHRKRAWDGCSWGAVVVDRDQVLQEHSLHAVLPPPGDVPTAPRALPPFGDAFLAEMALVGARPVDRPDGWRPDPAGDFRERFFRDGWPSDVVRTARPRSG